MKLAALSGFLIAAMLAACADVPGNGPADVRAVTGGGKSAGAVLYDVVKVDGRVVAAVRARPRPFFHALFPQGRPPPARIAVGDRLAVVIYEAGPGGLFTAPLPELPVAPNPTIEPLAPPAPSSGPPALPPPGPSSPSLEELLGLAKPRRNAAGELPPAAGAPQAPAQTAVNRQLAARTARIEQQNREGAAIPAQVVARDGTIAIPYAGRVPAAGRTPAELEREIEARLAKKALAPQAVVVDEGGPAHTAAVTGAVVHGARVPLSPAGDRLLQVIAEAGGAKAPVRDLFIRLSRGGVTATLPFETLVREPAENIYAWPGDAVTLIRLPRTFSVFGAAKRNAQLRFGADRLTLAEALAKTHWLIAEVANARGVFVFRYESDAVLRALGQPLATAAQGGVSPVVYRFDLHDPKYFFLARRFPMRDKDIVFVVDAAAVSLYKWFHVLGKITGPVVEGLVVCYTTSGC